MENSALKRHLLLWCAQQYLYPFCNQLLEAGADFTIYQGGNGETLLHLACRAGARQAVKKLLSLGLPIDSQDKNEKTPLHIAVELEDPGMVSILIENNANPNIISKEGETPLSHALKKLSLHRSSKPSIDSLERGNNLQKIVDALESKSCQIQ